MEKFIGYQCSICGKEFDANYSGYTCDCCSGNLNVVLDYDGIRKFVKPEDIFSSNEKSLWRYLPLLPVEDPGFEGTALHSAGLTPVFKSTASRRKRASRTSGSRMKAATRPLPSRTAPAPFSSPARSRSA